jgi:hypothetical protein
MDGGHDARCLFSESCGQSMDVMQCNRWMEVMMQDVHNDWIQQQSMDRSDG